MLDHNDDQTKKPDLQNDHDRALDKLEEMWDRELLRGDDYGSKDFDLSTEDNRRTAKGNAVEKSEIRQSKGRSRKSI